MITLYFKDMISILTTIFVLAVLTLITVSMIRRKSIEKWGRLILIIVLAGTAISGLSATRDAYMMQNALFSAGSFQSILCAAVGGLISLIGIISIFIRRQAFRRLSFELISALIIAQVVTIEASRIVMLLGGVL